jgi:hypothetical protein
MKASLNWALTLAFKKLKYWFCEVEIPAYVDQSLLSSWNSIGIWIENKLTCSKTLIRSLLKWYTNLNKAMLLQMGYLEILEWIKFLSWNPAESPNQSFCNDGKDKFCKGMYSFCSSTELPRAKLLYYIRDAEFGVCILHSLNSLTCFFCSTSWCSVTNISVLAIIVDKRMLRSAWDVASLWRR